MFSSLERERVSSFVRYDTCCQYSLRRRRPIVQGAVGPEGTVFHSPPFDEYSDFFQGLKDLAIQQFVSELTVEAFTVAVFPRAPRFDVEGSYACSFEPLAYCLSGEFRAVI